jgi:hypothetical protein
MPKRKRDKQVTGLPWNEIEKAFSGAYTDLMIAGITTKPEPVGPELKRLYGVDVNNPVILHKLMYCLARIANVTGVGILPVGSYLALGAGQLSALRARYVGAYGVNLVSLWQYVPISVRAGRYQQATPIPAPDPKDLRWAQLRPSVADQVVRSQFNADRLRPLPVSETAASDQAEEDIKRTFAEDSTAAFCYVLGLRLILAKLQQLTSGDDIPTEAIQRFCAIIYLPFYEALPRQYR